MMAGLRHRGRRRAVAELLRSRSGPLVDYYRDPLTVDHNAPWREAAYLVLEVDSRGNESKEGEPRSVGWIEVDGGVAVMGSAQHHIIDPDASSGAPAEHVVADLLDELRGRVLVCHSAESSIGPISAVCRQRWGSNLWPWLLVDTMQWHLERSGLFRSRAPSPEVQLSALLDRYDLPPTGANAPLSDAFGTALLFLAMAETSGRSDNGRPRRVGELLDRRSWTM